jgi:HEPN domain-containing protein
MKKATRAWLEFAHRDLEAARLLAGNEYLSNAVLFHSQQCVEKSLKALLEENGVPVPHIHNIVKLGALLQEEGKISISLDEDELDLVDAVYIDTRYPTGLGLLPSGFPKKEDANMILRIAEKFYEETSERLAS